MLDHLDLSSVRAVALDVDGTLAGDDSRVSPRTIEAMRRVQSLGIPVIVLTGRTRRNTLEIAQQAGLHVAIACNGALIIDPTTDENLAANPMTVADKHAFTSMADDLGLELTWWTEHHMYVTGEGPMRDLIRELNHEVADIGNPETIEDAVVMKMMALGPAEHLDSVADEIIRRVPTAQRSMDRLYEVVDPDSTKWHALEWALQRYGIDPAHVLGAGDGGNDVVWMSRIGLPVAMSNARAEVHAVSVAKAPSNVDEGVAVLLELLLEAKAPR